MECSFASPPVIALPGTEAEPEGKHGLSNTKMKSDRPYTLAHYEDFLIEQTFDPRTASIDGNKSDLFLKLTTSQWIEQETLYAQQRCARVLKMAMTKRREFAIQESQNIIFLMAMVARLCWPMEAIVAADSDFVKPPRGSTALSIAEGEVASRTRYEHWQEFTKCRLYAHRKPPKLSVGQVYSSNLQTMLFATCTQSSSYPDTPVDQPEENPRLKAVIPDTQVKIEQGLDQSNEKDAIFSEEEKLKLEHEKRFWKGAAVQPDDLRFHKKMKNLTLDAIGAWVDYVEEDMPKDTSEGVFSYQLLNLHFMEKPQFRAPSSTTMKKYKPMKMCDRTSWDAWLYQRMSQLMQKMPLILLADEPAELQRIAQADWKLATTHLTLQWVISNAVLTKCVVGNCVHPCVYDPKGDYVMEPTDLVTKGVGLLTPELLEDLKQKGTRFDSYRSRRHCLLNQCEDEIYFITHLILVVSWWGTKAIGYPPKNSPDRDVWEKLAVQLTQYLDDLLATAEIETKNREVALELACCLLIFCFNSILIPRKAYDLVSKYVTILQLLTRYRGDLRYERAGQRTTTYVGYCPIGRGRLHVDYHTHILLSMFLQMYRLCSEAGKLSNVFPLIYHFDTTEVRCDYRHWVFHRKHHGVRSHRDEEQDEFGEDIEYDSEATQEDSSDTDSSDTTSTSSSSSSRSSSPTSPTSPSTSSDFSSSDDSDIEDKSLATLKCLSVALVRRSANKHRKRDRKRKKCESKPAAGVDSLVSTVRIPLSKVRKHGQKLTMSSVKQMQVVVEDKVSQKAVRKPPFNRSEHRNKHPKHQDSSDLDSSSSSSSSSSDSDSTSSSDSSSRDSDSDSSSSSSTASEADS